MKSVITGTGSFVPTDTISNRDFTMHDFYDQKQQRIAGAASDIIKKFEQVTGIYARRYAKSEVTASSMGVTASELAIADAGIDQETIDYIIVAHNFGDVNKHAIQSEAVPSLASKVKQRLGINNPNCVAYDLLFGCPGWIQGLIQADCFIKSGLATKCLVIGTETLSRVIDKYDRDSMIFSDGAGAVVLERKDDGQAGIIGSVAQSYCVEQADYIQMGKSNFPDSDPRIRFMKMAGRKVYEFALTTVPVAMKQCLDKSEVNIADLKKIFIHQANEKMDAAIVKAFYGLYGIQVAPELVMPMNIRELGNSSVATVPTLLDMVRRGAIPDQHLTEGDIVLFASVGAGMNINAVCYRI